jgi:hypothetical protein
MNPIKTLGAVLGFLVATVKAIEELRGGGSGQEKKAELMDALRLFASFFWPAEAVDAIVKWGSAVTDIAVTLFNAFGIFKRSSA